MSIVAASVVPWTRTPLFPCVANNNSFITLHRDSSISCRFTVIWPENHFVCKSSTFRPTGYRKSLISNRRAASLNCSASEAASPGENRPEDNQYDEQNKGFWAKWKRDTAEMSSKLAKLGLAAVLAYGLFDGVTYTTFFILAFLGYEKSTGKNPAANLKALLGIVILMWTGNNVTRPFRVAGAAALAPIIDKGLMHWDGEREGV
ncbi:PREDICTED: uncharacterized protein LOC104596337 isoform X2 [Nelumbo nucifera]|uniref:Uncharacterized protein LOC104596337 isoform X2 n=1 Tax=Nelumbo nucifera TaxID=4432 RepID=A0A1U7ZQM7_NELNU|nr:PREDICTED: uncharacterized protein LOC104596337 isoform X2 [Nelumbo nucifera]